MIGARARFAAIPASALALVVGYPALAGSAPAPCPASVKVVDQATGRPVAATIRNAGGIVVAMANAQGHACVPATESRGRLVVSAPSYLEASIPPVGGTARIASRRVTLTKGAHVRLSVATGTPPSPAKVAWRTRGGGWHEGATAADGIWDGEVGPRDGEAHLVAGAVGFAVRCARLPTAPAFSTLRWELEPSATISARVADARTGAAIPGVRLAWVRDRLATACPADLPAFAHPSGAARDAATGTWRLSGLPAGRGIVEIEAPGYAPRRVGPIDLAAGAWRTLDAIALQPAPGVFGRVVDGAERPVPGAKVGVHGLWGDGDPIAAAVADAEGRFAIPLDGAHGQIRLRVRAPHGREVWIGPFAPGESEIHAMFPAAARLTVRVTTEEDSPVAGAAVSIRRVVSGDEGWADELTAVSDEEGTFRADELAPGRWRVSVASEDFPPATQVTVAVEEGEARFLAVVLPEGRTVRGTIVYDEDDRPGSGSTVFLHTNGRDERPIAVADDDGRFEADGLPAGRAILIARDEEGARGDARLPVGGAPVAIRLRRPAVIEGRVTGVDGSPSSGRRVELSREGAGTTTDGDGRFRFERLTAGRCRVTLLREDLGDRRAAESRDLVLEPGVTAQVEFGGGVILRGEVLVEDLPAADVPITLARLPNGKVSGNGPDALATARTDAAGRFEVAGLRPGAYAVSASLGRFRVLRKVSIDDPGPSDVRLVLRGTEVRGRVASKGTGTPIAGARVSIFDPRTTFVVSSGWRMDDETFVEVPQTSGEAVEAVSDANGVFRFRVPNGRFRLEATARGYRKAQLELEVTDSETPSPVVLLDPTYRIGGTVADPWGRPIAGARVSVSYGRESLWLSSDEAGEFDATGLPLEPCILLAQAGEFVGWVEGVLPTSEEAGPITEVRVSLPGRIEKVLPDGIHPATRCELFTPHGVPLGMLLERIAPPDRTRPAPPTPGVIVWNAVPAGRFVVAPAGDPSAGESVQVVSGESVRLDAARKEGPRK